MIPARPIKILALLVALCLVTPIGLASAAPPQATATVTITGSGQVKVDGAAAVTGSTLFSGSRITTAGGSGATIVIGGTQVVLSENTDAVVTFAPTAVRVDVVCGSASTS